MSRKRQSNKRQELNNANIALFQNGKAMEEGRKIKHWTTHDIKSVQPLTPAQEDVFHSWFNEEHICLHGSAGTGKAQPLDSKILTPRGWTTMGEIAKNDFVITPDGKTAKVIEIFPQGKKDIFVVSFHDGSMTRCCGEHLWEVWYPPKRKCKSENFIVDTYEMIRLIADGISISIPLIKPAITPPIHLPLSPYLLGALLGDGGLTVQIIFSTKDDEILEYLSEEIDENYIFTKASGIYDYRLVCKNTSSRDTSRDKYGNIYKQILDDLGIMGKKSNKKFIPEIYMNCGLEQKLELIRGLMDTDGTVHNNIKGGSCISYTTVSKELAHNIQMLLWSIGATCTITSRIPTYTYKNVKKKGQLAYTLHIAHPTPKTLFKLLRKKDKCLDSFNNGRTTLRRRVSSIELDSFEEAQCIMVDHPEHLYITDDFVVTHNTFLGLYLALNEVLQKNQRKIIIVRSAVTTREVGFLPGTLEEKVAQYEIPYQDILADLVGKDATYQDMKESRIIEFMTTSFIRGLTWDNAIVIVDEGENMTFHEINSIMTRLGKNSRIIFTGDILQTDLDGKKHGVSGMADALKVFHNMDDFACVQFTKHDIVRSDFVRDWIIATEDTLKS